MLGIGATTGGVSIVSSGAFTSTSADRDVTVRVADDAGSYLGLSVGPGPNGVFAMSTADDTDTSNGQLGINLTNARARVARTSARTQPRCPLGGGAVMPDRHGPMRAVYQQNEGIPGTNWQTFEESTPNEILDRTTRGILRTDPEWLADTLTQNEITAVAENFGVTVEDRATGATSNYPPTGSTWSGSRDRRRSRTAGSLASTTRSKSPTPTTAT